MKRIWRNCNDENKSFVIYLRKMSIYRLEKFEENYSNSHNLGFDFFILHHKVRIKYCRVSRLKLFTFGFSLNYFVFDSVVMFHCYGNSIIAPSSVYFYFGVAVLVWSELMYRWSFSQFSNSVCQVSASISGPGIPNSKCHWNDGTANYLLSIYCFVSFEISMWFRKITANWLHDEAQIIIIK